MHKVGNSIVVALKKIPRLLPTACIVCGRSVAAAAALCEACTLTLPWITSACCKCGESGLHVRLRDNLCNRCLLAPPSFRFCRGLFHYSRPVDTLLSGFKFHAHFAAGHALASLLASEVHGYYQQHTKPDAILPVPLHRNRLRTRGYNQAAEIANVVSSACKIPVRLGLASRDRDTAPQTEIGSATARRKNLRKAFRVVENSTGKSVSSIAIIDDVVTTMATVTALSDALQLQGIEVVDIWCIARASR